MMARFAFFLLITSLCIVNDSLAQSEFGWNPDYNGDDVISIEDILAVLGVFAEQDSDGDGIWDSQDDCIGSEDSCGPCDVLAVDEDADGVCDELDDCVGAYDECGVCNGPGPNIPVIDEIIYETDSAYNPFTGEWSTFQLPVDTLFSYVCPVLGCLDPSSSNYDADAEVDDGSCVTDVDACGDESALEYSGIIYDLVAIGNQCWFADNLRTENYSNGDAILGNLIEIEWLSVTDGAQAVYNDNDNYLSDHGRLYNWYAVNDVRGLCPCGWHVPSDAEWTELVEFLGGDGNSGTVGAKLKSSPMDFPGWNGTNVSGFSAIPGGMRSSEYGGYVGLNSSVGWWSSTSLETSFASYYRSLGSSTDFVTQGSQSSLAGYYVRCLKD